MNRLRNEFAHHVCNFLINHIAVGQYRDYLRVVWHMGTKGFDEEFWKRYEQRQEEQELA